MYQKIRYFSVAVTDIDDAIRIWTEVMGMKQMTEVKETRWGFKNCMVGNGEQAFIEIIQPSDPNSALARLMKERENPRNPGGEGIYLVGIETDDLKGTVQHIKDAGGRVTEDEASPNAAWVYPLTLRNVLIELQQARES